MASLDTGATVIVDPPKFMQENAQQQTVVVDGTPKPIDPALQVKPKSSCRHCYGRGYVGTNTETGQKIICRCVKRSFAQVNRLQKELDAKLKGQAVDAKAGWDDPKTPVIPA